MVQLSKFPYRCWWGVLWSFCNIFHRKKTGVRYLVALCWPINSQYLANPLSQTWKRFLLYVSEECHWKVRIAEDMRSPCVSINIYSQLVYILQYFWHNLVYRILLCFEGMQTCRHTHPARPNAVFGWHLPRMHTTSHLDTQAFGAFQDILSGRDPVDQSVYLFTNGLPF